MDTFHYICSYSRTIVSCLSDLTQCSALHQRWNPNITLESQHYFPLLNWVSSQKLESVSTFLCRNGFQLMTLIPIPLDWFRMVRQCPMSAFITDITSTSLGFSIPLSDQLDRTFNVLIYTLKKNSLVFLIRIFLFLMP